MCIRDSSRTCGATLSRIAPSWINLCVLAFRSFFRFLASASSCRCFACKSAFSSGIIVFLSAMSGTSFFMPVSGLFWFWFFITGTDFSGNSSDTFNQCASMERAVSPLSDYGYHMAPISVIFDTECHYNNIFFASCRFAEALSFRILRLLIRMGAQRSKILS